MAMDEPRLLEQAKTMALLLPALMRKLFALDASLAAELPLAQLRVCGILYRGQQRMSALSRELGVSLSAMTQIADRLERARLVKRVAEGSDRRIRCLQLTERGRDVMRQHEQTHVKSVLAALGRLTSEARQQLLASLETLIDACDSGNGDDVCITVTDQDRSV
jgi:DNA-binding MarR family transcriptional regulator